MDDNKNFENSFENNDEKQSFSNDITNENTNASGAEDGFSSDGTYRFSSKSEDAAFPMREKFNVYSPLENTDYNTLGVNYQSSDEPNEFSNYNSSDKEHEFYNTNIKKGGKRVPVYVVVIAVILTAAVSLAGAFGSNYLKRRIALMQEGKTPMSQGNTKGSAVVENASVSRDGKKVLSTPEIVDKVGPAVVGVLNTTEVTREGLFYDFFGGGGTGIEQSTGSGVVISSDGYIVTNNHVIAGATNITVIMNTGHEYSAKLIGADSKTDLAVIKIEAQGLTYAFMGSSSDLRVGDTAIAIGNPLGQEFAGTTTQGIISGLNRSISIDDKELTLIQTDAAINPGNSGGALVDAYGHLIGINTAKISSSSLEGLGFAIPIDTAKPVIEELIDNGYVTGRPILGIGGRTVTEEDAKAYGLKVGVYVTSMSADSPAYLAGIKIGDIIVECNGKKVTTVEEINEIKNKFNPGDKLKLKVYRQDRYKTLSVVLGEETPS